MPGEGLASLTPTERQVLEQYQRTPAIKDVARVLGSSPNTIRAHLSAVRAKLHVNLTQDAVRMLPGTRADVAHPPRTSTPETMGQSLHGNAGSEGGSDQQSVFRDAAWPTQTTQSSPWLPPLFGRPGERNDLGTWQRIKDIGKLIALISMGASAIVSTLTFVSLVMARASPH